MDKQDMLFDLIRDIDIKQDTISESQIRMESQVQRNTESLAEHMKRTECLEKLVQQHKLELDARLTYIEKPWYIKVITKHNVKWILGVISVVLAIYISLIQITKNF